MNATAASNPATTFTAPVTSSPPPAGGRSKDLVDAASTGQDFGQLLQRRLQQTQPRGEHHARPSRPAAERQHSAEAAPGTPAEAAASAAGAAQMTADAANPPGGEPPTEDTIGNGIPSPQDAAAILAALGPGQTPAPADATAEQNEGVTLIAGLPAGIAAILHDLAGRQGNTTGEGEAAALSDAAPAAPLDISGNSAQATRNPLATLSSEAEAGTASGNAPTAAADAPSDFPAQLQAIATADAAGDRAAPLPQQPANTEIPAAAMAGTATVGGVAQTDHAAPQRSVPQFPVNTPVGDSAWADDVGSRVTLLVGRGESKAELVLTPPSLGRVEVSLTVDGDKTTAQFVASTPAARDALEQALPRLREALQQAGVNLGQTNVSTSGDQQAGQQGDGQRRGTGRGEGIDGGDGISAAGSTTNWVRRSEGVVDTFA